MVEMLGVLAIIGVLSVTGIAGYTTAMNKHRANELMNEASKRAIVVSGEIVAGNIPSISEFTNRDFGYAVFDDKVYGEDGTSLWTTNDKKFALQIKLVSEKICKNLQNSIGGIVQGFDPFECEDDATVILTYNNDLSKEKIENTENENTANTGVPSVDGWTGDDGSNCLGQTKLGECSVCVLGNYVDSDAVCVKKNGKGSICLDGSCKNAVSVESNKCMTNSDCKNQKTSDNVDCEDSLCYCSYNYNNVSGCYQSDSSISSIENGNCVLLQSNSNNNRFTPITVNNVEYIYTNFVTTWWGAKNFCQSLGKRMLSYTELGCSLTNGCSSDSLFRQIKNQLTSGGATWTSNIVNKESCSVYFINASGTLKERNRTATSMVICR